MGNAATRSSVLASFLVHNEAFLLTTACLLVTLLQLRFVNTSHPAPAWLSWGILWSISEVSFLVWSRTQDRGDVRLSKVRSNGGETLVALAITASSMCEHYASVKWILPVTALLLENHQDMLSINSEKVSTLRSTFAFLSWQRFISVVATILSVVILLPDVLTASAFTLGICFGIFQWIVFFGIARLNKRTEDGAFGESEVLAQFETARSLSARGLVLYMLMSLLMLSPVVIDGRAILYSLIEATRLATTFALVSRLPTSLAPTITVFATATDKFGGNISSFGATAFMVVAEAALYRIAEVLKGSPRRMFIFWLLCLYPIALLFIWRENLLAKHPIALLMDNAKAAHAIKLQSQSETLGQAIKEYRRRYKRQPPPGFDDWFHTAKKLNVTMIDEYDTLTKSFEPYWSIPPAMLRENVMAAQKYPDEVNNLLVKDGNFTTTMPDQFQLLSELVKQAAMFRDVLPDLNIPIIVNRFSDHDLPRVLLPKDTSYDYDFEWIDLAEQDTWDVMTQVCPPVKAYPRTLSMPHSSSTLKFLSDVAASKDVCSHPELRYRHGAWSPQYKHAITNNPFPIFSQTKLSTHSDILIPSAYYSDDFRRNTAGPPASWHNKTNNIYWAGATTGLSLTGFKQWTAHPSHRHHLVSFANSIPPYDANETVLLQQSAKGKPYTPYTLPFQSQHHLYDISFSHLVQCGAPACNAQRAIFRPTTEQSHWAHETHRLLMDIDGNSFSGRFYRLMEANATVFKITAFKEVHDDILQPWLHYVPISVGMEELGEAVRYFAEEGESRAWDIAREALKWAKMSLRREDSAAGVARAVLEYKRVMSEQRETMGCCGAGTGWRRRWYDTIF